MLYIALNINYILNVVIYTQGSNIYVRIYYYNNHKYSYNSVETLNQLLSIINMM